MPATGNLASLLRRPGLLPIDVELARILDRAARRHPEVWHSTRTLAARLGRSVRTVQLALARLTRAGLVARIRDYGLNTRRRIVLLWRGGLGATASPPVAPTNAPPVALTPVPPSDSPLVSPEIEEEFVFVSEGFDTHHEAPLSHPLESLGVPAPTHQPEPTPLAEALPPFGETTTTNLDPPRKPERRPEPVPRPDPAVVRETLALATAKARELFPDLAEPEAWVLGEARRTGPNNGRMGVDWVRKALEYAEVHKAYSHGYVRRTLDDWHRRGGYPGPPPRKRVPVAPPVGRVVIPDECDLAGPLSPEEEVSTLEALASLPEPRNPIAAFARRQLARLKGADPR